MASCPAASGSTRFGLTECARMTLLKTAVALVVILGAGVYTGETGWLVLAAVLVSFSTLVVGFQVLLSGKRPFAAQNSSVNRHAR
ncbi:hypothetical protein EJC49_17960 [Aquibium carbonis]|uniref:Uncharacterized protein n=1 Tax=Aquibium carbonis TaxID=2495581 RepID=A0A3R9Y617_9HYPH|nr:hypothetical protein [Aquibium carbonis]RST84967.1 hypothetical protein EJC49_17960 [Aquibium carbonis]